MTNKIYDISWNWDEKKVIEAFDVATDVFHFEGGFNFSHLSLSNNDQGDAVLGVPKNQQSYTLTGVDMAAFTASNFTGIDGDFDRLGETEPEVDKQPVQTPLEEVSFDGSRGDYDAFKAALITFESGVNLQNNTVYESHLDSNGNIPADSTSGYYRNLKLVLGDNRADAVMTRVNADIQQNGGVTHLTQTHSVNGLGFAGYQVGEPILMDTGYYKVAPDQDYFGSGAGINFWKGSWTSKANEIGLQRFEDLLQPKIQNQVIDVVFAYNMKIISDEFTKAGKSLADLLGHKVHGIEVTLSGIIAAAHLRGAWGAAALLLSNTVSVDENGTNILKYFAEYGGYQTPFDADFGQ